MFAGGGGGGGGARLGPAGHGPLPQARLLACVDPAAPVEIGVRGNLTATLLDQAVMLTPRHCSMALAVTYVVFPVREEPPVRSHGHHPDRVGVFVRWGLGFDPDAQGAPMLERRASRNILQAYSAASATLYQYYHLAPQASGELDKRLQAEIADQRVVELSFTHWDANTDWLAPMQVRPMLDLLLRQPRFAAIQFSLAWSAAPAQPAGAADQQDAREDETPATADAVGGARADSAPGYHAHIAALGAAIHHDALWLLAKELRGCGALVIPRADRPASPGVHAAPPGATDDHQRIARNLLGPAAVASNPAAQVTYTRDEAVTLFPLPFKAD